MSDPELGFAHRTIADALVPPHKEPRSRLSRLFSGLDWRSMLGAAALIVALVMVFTFVNQQRSLSAHDKLLKESAHNSAVAARANKELADSLAHQQSLSDKRFKISAAQRTELSAQIHALIRYLKAHGIVVPAAIASADTSGQAPVTTKTSITRITQNHHTTTVVKPTPTKSPSSAPSKTPTPSAPPTCLQLSPSGLCL